ncbi:MAG TPA: hypothetical protein PKE27_17580 [Povalibacter sp.]|uniref:thrombospondin type 3 repeat-containing protein n=1 Tax=Povalibacter sp. TaxID=1962978 RepID=UPI002B6D7C2F|nr:hypothetical protein [Povalibacter sp.]HMN46394.1 hypothetical protein [Povalibacter sp.]
MNTAAPVSIEGGEYSIDGGAFTSVAGSISSAQTLAVRTRASTNYSRISRTRVTVGTVSENFEVTSELPNYIPDAVVYDDQDIVYLLDNAHSYIFRWSIGEARYLDAYVLAASASSPTTMAYSGDHGRLYLGYGNGAIRFLDVTAADPVDAPFAQVSGNVMGLASVGRFVLAQDDAGAWGTHYILDRNGVATDQKDWNYYSRQYAWDGSSSRVYFFRDSFSPNDLLYETIDQSTGKITSQGETPYHGAYSIQPPIRVSANGSHVLLGSGDIYNRTDLAWAGSLGSQVTDARWFADSSIVALISASSNQTVLRRLGANRTVLEQRTFNGQPLRVMGTDARMAVLIRTTQSVEFHTYVPSDDSDGDGVANTQDAFPLDAAASVDTDRDGYPDAWNAGMTGSDSTTGLALDAYPQDAACYLPGHGDGVNCDYSATLPNYVPDRIVAAGDTVYLLSSANRRVYRWSIASGAYLNPYVVGIDQGFSTLAPTTMAHSPDHQRLYLGYGSGAIHYIDLAASSPVETSFATTAMGLGGLAAVGNYVLAQDDSGAWATHYVFDRNGALTDQEDWNYYSREYAWDAASSRVYFLRDDTSPNDLMYEVIDQATGTIAEKGESPYHGAYSIQTPIRVSAGGQYVLLGSGDIYNRTDLTWSGSLGGQIVDARWMANGSIVTLSTAGNQTVLRRLGTNLTVLEQMTYAGQALQVVGSDARMAVLVVENGTVRFRTYVPNDDSDGDGVANTQDAFPLDAAASMDTDRDGYPDAWNPGRSQGDSTTGLSLDAYPQDSACYLPGHGDGVNCDYGATIPNYVPDQVVRGDDTIYLLSSANRRVYRWSVSAGRHLNPYVVGINQGFSTLAPTAMAYSSDHQRLYLGYTTGAIRYIDLAAASAAETPFTNTAMGVGGLAAVGNHLLAQDGSGAWATHYIFNRQGALTDQAEWNYSSGEYAWDPVSSRVYFFRDSMSPNDLHFEVIEQTTGTITAAGETPYHGAYAIQPPIRVSAGGQYVLLGSGDIYNQSGLSWAGSLGMQVVDARWFADGSIAALTNIGNQAILRRLGANRATLEQISYTGRGLRVVGTDAGMVVVTIDNGVVQFHAYTPSNDSDGDGVTNTQDAFPLDPAASVDTDRDHYPDAWNAGMSQSDSTTGLSLDAYAQDSACWLPAHGNGVQCNYGATVPSYIPDKIASDDDVIYLLSGANQRVYRWSIASGEYLNPYVVGIDQGFSTLAPTTMSYSSAHQRLYLGYSTGAIRYVDVSASNAPETPFANTSMGVGGLAAVGNYVLAQDPSGAWATHYIFDRNGVLTDQREWNQVSRDYAWDPVTSRVYFFRDGMSPNDLHYEVIDQTTGSIAGQGESPYHGSFSIEPPIRVAPDGQYILLGTGDVYDSPGLTYAGALGAAIADAHWRDGVLVTLDTTDRLDIRDEHTRAVLASYQYLGQPLRIAFGQTGAFLVHVVNNTTAFLALPFGDQDLDTLPRWWEQLYGLSDANAADALGDLDGDGVSNADEYQNRSDPTVVDSDGDGLTDFEEIVTYATNPAQADSDGDRLNDREELLTYNSDPWDPDSDGDGYTDFDEALYGGDPNDPTGLPSPITSFSQGFEGTPDWRAWSTPAGSSAPWMLDSTVARTGSASIRSGAVGVQQSSSTRFRAVFAAGRLSFHSRFDSSSGCCDRLAVLVDGVEVASIWAATQWTQTTVPITVGPHDIEWRYVREDYYGPGTTVWIDDVAFAP